MQHIVKERIVRRDDEFQITFAMFNNTGDIDSQLYQVVLIQRTHWIINEDVLQVIKLVGIPITLLSKI